MVGPITLIGPAVLIADLIIKQMVVLYIAVGVIAIELVAKYILRMTFGMFVRKTLRGIVAFFFGAGIRSNPVSWNRHHLALVLSVITIAASQPMSAEAAFTATDSVKYDRTWRSGMIGQRPEDTIEAMCNGCPLSIGLKTAIPADFVVMIADELKNKKISFTGSRPWGQIIQDVAAQNDLRIEILRHGNKVLVEKSAPNRGEVIVTALMAKSETFFESKRWELIPGDSLKDSLTRWAKSEGWNLVYLLDNDLKIDVPAVFQGNLLEAVEQVLKSYKEMGILTRVEMIYTYANNTISISLGSGGAQ